MTRSSSATACATSCAALIPVTASPGFGHRAGKPLAPGLPVLALAAQAARDIGSVDQLTVASALTKQEVALPPQLLPYHSRGGAPGAPRMKIDPMTGLKEEHRRGGGGDQTGEPGRLAREVFLQPEVLRVDARQLANFSRCPRGRIALTQLRDLGDRLHVATVRRLPRGIKHSEAPRL